MAYDLHAVAAQFAVTADFANYGNGHINDTFLSSTEPHVILQRINTAVFTDPCAVMENICGVTEHLRKKLSESGGDLERGTLSVIKTQDGRDYVETEEGDCFRMYRFVENSTSFDLPDKPERLCAAGQVFGRFQKLLGDYNADSLHETIAHFHDTPMRVSQLEAAAANDAAHRLASVGEEMKEARAYGEKYASVIVDAIAEGSVPLRVTHNDTKLNNVLFDRDTLCPLCVTDLDTVMPGSLLYDFGDALRSGAMSTEEHEPDSSKVYFDLEKFDCFAKGFLSEMGDALTEREIELLPLSALVMTYECGTRFLADYLNGDTYFKVHREGQNLDRARVHLALVRDIEKKLPEMQEIVQRHIHQEK
ncbi:MAG: phosphotransferase [Oscillospiraceae bacterium]|nr:phosphotransferase [Oscillospiraceae bacterium]